MSVNFSDKRSPCDIAKIRAQQLRRVRQEVNPFRARSQYGEPVIFQKLKERSNISRRSRVMSDPEIPSALVILNAKGLFEGKKGAERKTETRYAPVGKMNEEGCKPMFCDPSNNNNGRVSDLKKRFESLERDNVVSSAGSEFFNPLHKGNQPAVSSKRTSREVRIDVQTKLGKALNENDTDLEKKRNSKVADSENLLQNKYLDTTKISKTLPSKLDNVVEIPNTSTKQSNSALKMEDGKLKETSNESVKESELVTSPPPNRPPPRHPLHSPKKEPLKYCRDKSGDENAVSRISQAKEDVEENVLQQESILEGQQNTGSKTFSNSTLDGNDTSSGFDIDDDDSDDWGSDFDEDGDEKEENENISKHDSHSSHGSSCEADPIIEFPDAVSKKLYNIVSEILSTERAYVRRLYLLDQVFYHRLNNECCAQGSVPGEALNDIFSNIQAIHQLHRDFLLPKLEARIKDWANNNQIGDILKGLAPFLKMYTLYVGNFDKATETLSTWMKKSPAMTAVIEEIQKSKECENLTLQHHMLEPVQRVPRYQLLLKDYLSKLPEDSEDLKNTSDALGIISESARHANDSMKKTERFKILLDIQDRIGDDFPLITASREFVMEGEFKKVAARTSESHQERTLMLFNDVLLCCAKFPGSNKYKVKVEMDLYGMEIRTEDEDLEIENAFRIISKQRVMDFTAPNAEARETFVNKLKEAVDECTNKRDSYKKSSNVVLKEGELGKKAPAWVRDEAVSMCMLCDVLFTKLRRRHHCRACGRVVCGSCSGYKAAMEFKNGKMEKVCEMCHRILVKGSSEEKAKEAVVKGKSILKINSDSKIWYSGYLNFKMRGDKSWQKRWFVLSSDFVLFRYKAKKDIKAELTLPLPGHNVDKPSLADEVERKNVFKVHHKNMRVHFFQAQNEDSVNRWMEILTKATKAEQVDTEEEEEEGKTQRAGTQ